MKKVLINGQFLGSAISGVERYAIEMVKELDKIAYDMDVSILVPKHVAPDLKFENIKIYRSGIKLAWTKVVFGLRARFMGAMPLCLCNEVSTLAPGGITTLHDVVYAENNGLFPDGAEKNWFVNNYKTIAKKSKLILTDSEFSKSRICELLGVKPEKIEIIPTAWQHFDVSDVDEKELKAWPDIKAGEYYFTLASVNKNKNTKWVIDTAILNPQSTFVLAGKMLDNMVDFSKVSNVKYVGYVSDAQAKALMKYCKAFLFPSLYEGFGMPPMEAMCLGAPIIISDKASLPEVYGKSAHYIDAGKPQNNLDDILLEPVEPAQNVLDRYSWSKSAARLKELIANMKG